MKRYVCTAVAALGLALVGAGTATAGGLTDLAPSGSQAATFAGQSVGTQKNDADVQQTQGNGNVNIAPAVAVFGDADTTNSQGNGNTASSSVGQSNAVDQSQSATQTQGTDGGSARCCTGPSQTAEQQSEGGDQSVDKQKNDADVSQEQGNGNLNIAPAVAIFGDATTSNSQGNHNSATSSVSQSNSAKQSQTSVQRQATEQKGTKCCDGQSQAGSQETTFGDQSVGKQRNDAGVWQTQGNGNVDVAPAIAIGGGKERSCLTRCDELVSPFGGKAETTNSQGNGNTASSSVGQSNSVEQSQSAKRDQRVEGDGGCCKSKPEGGKKPGCCRGEKAKQDCDDERGRAEQDATFGDQSVGQQRNNADVWQTQGNRNLNIAPAVAILGDATTSNSQGNGNTASSSIHQSNQVEQKQASWQRQSLADRCEELI